MTLPPVSFRSSWRGWWNRIVTCGVVMLLSLLAMACAGLSASTAADLDKAATSLRLVPTDASTYYVSLRNKEWWDLLANSRAWTKFKELPYVQLAGGFIFSKIDQPGGPLDQVQEFFKQPDNQPLGELLAEMFSDEVFWFVDKDAVPSAELLANLYGTMNFESRVGGPLRKALGDQDKPKLPNMLLRVLANNVEAVRVPNLVIGFKIHDAALAASQIKRLEDHLRNAPDAEVRDHVSRSKIGDAEYLLFSLDGEMVDWTETPINDYAETPGEFDSLIEHLKKQKLIVGVGIRGEFLLVSLGNSTDHLASLGQGRGLAERVELQPLAPFADRRLLNVAYVSQPMRAVFAPGKRQADDVVATVLELLSSGEVDPNLLERLKQDLPELAADVKPFLPDPGAYMAFAFLSGQGIESYRYDWSIGGRLDESKTLPLMEHVGAAPLLAVVQRGKHSLNEYDLLVKWLKKGHGYFEEFGLPKMDDKQREEYRRIMAAADPLLARLNKATRDMLLPALADGQFGLVLDAQEKSKQWLQAFRANNVPLPMIEPALVVSVSDAELLKEAMNEYFAIANDALTAAVDLSHGEIPKITLRTPQAQPSGTGTSYRYALPDEWGVDKQVMPNGWLGKDLAILSLAPQQTERLQTTSSAPMHGLSQDAARPLGTFVTGDWAGMVTAATPWIEFGIRRGLNPPNDDGSLPPDSLQTKLVLDQLGTTLEILKVFRGTTAVQYVQDGAHVTHVESRFQDIP